MKFFLNQVISKGDFNLRKWHSNIASLESKVTVVRQFVLNLFSSSSSHTKIIGEIKHPTINVLIL